MAFRRSSITADDALRTRTEENRVHHMQNYGTFDMDSIHGHLFELQVYVSCLKLHTLYYFGFVFLGMTLWPIAALLAIPVGLLAGRDRIFHRCKMYLVLSSVVGYLVNGVPACLIGMGGSFTQFYELVIAHESDWVQTWLSCYIVLLILVFAGMYSNIKIGLQHYKASAKQSWGRRSDEHGLHVEFRKAQAVRLKSFIPEDLFTPVHSMSRGSGSSMSRVFLDEGQCIFIGDIVGLLEKLPGWTQNLPRMDERLASILDAEKGIFNELTKVSYEAQQQNLWPIDIWVVDSQFYGAPGDNRDGLLHASKVACLTTAELMYLVFQYMFQQKLRVVVFAFLSFIRAILPHLWRNYVEGQELLPTDSWGPARITRVYSTLVAFVVGMCWMSLFFFLAMEYRRTLAQMVSFTAMADASRRIEYAAYYLVSSLWFSLSVEESKEVLAKLPLLDLRVSNNVVAFWRLREYITMDRSDESMGISILIQIVAIYLILEFLATVAVMYVSETIPSLFLVTVFDLVVIGGMILFSLVSSVQMNSTMESHKEILAKARYMVAQQLSNTSNAAEQRSDHIDEDEMLHTDQEMKLTRNLLLVYLDNLRESDLHDRILFGLTMTPVKLLSSAFTLVMMISAVISRMITKGQIKAPEEIKEHIVNQMAISLWNLAVNFVSHSNRVLHDKWHKA
mmetsp:Transcript_145262/g.253522  ORF Transcript_145262/g.253522 Transcript_145262/m.253522 type:complete len:677 (+) Transcript_145262:88-2118(+)